MNIFVDIDGILTREISGVPFKDRTPNLLAISHLNELYNKNKITLYTRRRLSDKAITVLWLKKYGVKYHKLLIGNKPNYDILIDDKTYSSMSSFLRKYNESVK